MEASDDAVYCRELPSDNRKFTLQYSGKNKQNVLARAENAVRAIDIYRSPHASSIYQRDGVWFIEVSYYSLD